MKLIISGMFLLFSSFAAADTLMPFVTDGCTDFPNGTIQQPVLWLHCCVEHDKLYWLGGSRDERLTADRGLRECVTETGHPETAQLMFEGVRVGGSPFLNTPWRWGYGWIERRGYRILTASEREMADRLKPAPN